MATVARMGTAKGEKGLVAMRRRVAMVRRGRRGERLSVGDVMGGWRRRGEARADGIVELGGDQQWRFMEEWRRE